MKRATEGMTGREIYRYYNLKIRENRYARMISTAIRMYGEEKAYAMLEEAEHNGNRLYAYDHPEDVKRGCSDYRTLFKVVSLEEYNSLMNG
ncbi:MAG: hypothetical protein SPJ29_05890 [Phocaeicola sp.]|nr:hypothetical protein [Phocaeicola sp.]MDD7447910.1 hypothetical protein [Prevotellaceae bacterium]MDY5939270.1 hypothetical protein [Phocaeicola sp.]